VSCKQVYPSAVELAQLIDSQQQQQHGDPNHFAAGNAAILPHEENNFFTDFQQGMLDFGGNVNAPDVIDEFLNQVLTDPDEHSSTTSKNSDPGIMPPEFENHGLMQVMILGFIVANRFLGRRVYILTFVALAG
jgi:hypothetical protein